MLTRLMILTAASCFAFLAASPAHAGKHDPIYTPEPIAVPAGKGSEEVKKAVRKALFDKGWEAREIGAGHMQGKHTKSGKNGSYTAVVDVRYDARTVRIGYKDSENLNYDKTDNTIHGTYNKWVRNLERNIRANLGAY